MYIMHIKTCVSSILCNEVKDIIFFINNLNNIHGFNTLKYVLWIFSQKKQVSLASILYHAYAKQNLPKLN
jgi:hypothetical protein